MFHAQAPREWGRVVEAEGGEITCEGWEGGTLPCADPALEYHPIVFFSTKMAALGLPLGPAELGECPVVQWRMCNSGKINACFCHRCHRERPLDLPRTFLLNCSGLYKLLFKKTVFPCRRCIDNY